jgi:hypothetical protein
VDTPLIRPTSYNMDHLTAHYYECATKVEALDPMVECFITLNPKHVGCLPVAFTMMPCFTHDKAIPARVNVEDVTVRGCSQLEWDEINERRSVFPSVVANPFYNNGEALPVDWECFTGVFGDRLLQVKIRNIEGAPVDVSLAVYAIPFDFVYDVRIPLLPTDRRPAPPPHRRPRAF